MHGAHANDPHECNDRRTGRRCRELQRRTHKGEMPALPSSWEPREARTHFSTLTTAVDEIAVEDVRIRARGVAAAGVQECMAYCVGTYFGRRWATAEIAAAE